MTSPLLFQRCLQSALVVTLLMAMVPAKASNPDTVVAWGVNTYGQTTVPAGLSGVNAIAAGYYHSVALKSDGTVAAWGAGQTNDSASNRDYGQCLVPPGMTNVTAIAAGYFHTLALKSDGTVAAWGAGQVNVLYNPNSVHFGQSIVPVGLSNVKALAAGFSHSVALKNDGTVLVWGAFAGSVPVGLSGVMAIAAGKDHNLALKTTGTVVAWGGNFNGQTNVPAGLSGVKAIAAGSLHTVALKNDGTVVAWGDNSSGQSSVPVGLSGVVAVAAGAYRTVAVKSDGSVVVWGDNGYGGNPQSSVPSTLSAVTAIAVGQYHTVAIGVILVPPTITVQPSSVTVNPASAATFSVSVTGFVPFTYQWRKDGTNVNGATNFSITLSNVQTNQVGNYSIVVTNFYGSVTSSVAVLTVGRVAQTISFDSLPTKRLNEAPFTLSATASSGLPVSFTSSNPGVATVSANTVTINGFGTIIITATQTGDANYLPISVSQTFTVSPITGWGLNDYGQATAPLGLSNITAIAASGNHTVALKSDGTVVAWGDDSNYKRNYIALSTVPAGLSGVKAIAAGGYHTLALKNDGSVVAWGENCDSGIASFYGTQYYCGQATVPIGLNNITAIAAGSYHSLALKQNGTVVAWGENYSGQVNGAASFYPSYTAPANPVTLNGVVLSGVTAIAAGDNHTVALRSDGSVVIWGANLSQPTVPPDLSGVSAIAAGLMHTVALKSNGTVVAWGGNGYGETNVPMGLIGVAAIAAGSQYTVALKSNGTVVAWGANFYSQVTIPTGLSGVTAIAAGFYHTVALVPAPLPSITTQPVNLTVDVTSNATFSAAPAGAGPFGFQWLKDGVLLAGQTNAQLNLSGLTNRARGGNFSVMVSNLYGAITGNIGSLRVRVPHRLQPPVATNGIFRLFSADQDGGLLTTNDLPYFSVQISTNLSSTNWMSFTYSNGLSLTSGMLRLDDTNAASRPFRYYRVIEQ